jgi:hypothetical protein
MGVTMFSTFRNTTLAASAAGLGLLAAGDAPAIMKRFFRAAIMVGVLLGFAQPSWAVPIVWTFSGVTFGDGGTVSGHFTFDADAGTACSTGATPCGHYSNVDVVTSTGSVRTGSHFTEVCGSDVPTCLVTSPDSTEVQLLTSAAPDQTGMPLLLFNWVSNGTPMGETPPAGLSDAGGTYDISASSLHVGFAIEATCENTGCTGFSGLGERISNAGFVVATVPEPPSWGLMMAGFLPIAGWRLGRGTVPGRHKSPAPVSYVPGQAVKM